MDRKYYALDDQELPSEPTQATDVSRILEESFDDNSS